MKSFTKTLIPVIAITALGLTGCAGPSGGGEEDPIVIGATLPLTGALQAFGTSLQTGYEAAIDEVNDAGGVTVDGVQRELRLVVQDNASTGDTASSQARDLILESGAVALLGPATPPLSVPVSLAAEQLQIPTLITITPLQAWKGANSSGWNWAWNVFFDENQMTDTQFQAADLVETNKKVALFTDQEEDGIVMGGLWVDKAPSFGYEIVSHGQFPVGNSNFSAQVAEAKAADAEVVIAQVIPPDGIALLREMKAQGYVPEVMFLEKAGNTGGFVELSDGLAEGILAANWFAEGIGTDREAEFIEDFSEEAGGVNSDLGTIVYGYSIAKILADAIGAAGSTDPTAINEAIGEISATYPAGQIAFDADHAAALTAVQTQWHGADQLLVFDGEQAVGRDIVTPVPGLQ